MIATVTLNPSLDEWVRLPSLRVGALNRAEALGRYPGGKGINVSRVVHELGGATIAYGLAGGHDGLILRELMNRLKILHEFVTVPGQTRNNYKIRTDRPHALTELNTAGPAVSATALRALERRMTRRRPRPQVLVCSGSVPPGVPAAIYQRWIRAFGRLGMRVVLDASGEAMRLGVRARPWLIKPNRHEAEEVLGRRIRTRLHAVHAAQQLVARGASLVVLSLGAEGAMLASRDQERVWMAQLPKVKSDSAVGAGDSVVAGFLVGWQGGRSLLEAFRLGVASGTATAMTPGTELCHRRDVQRLVRRVVIRRVD